MSDTAVTRRADDDLVVPIVAYVLNLLGLGLVGLILAYIRKGGAGEVARSHYVFQIRTIWIGLSWLLLGGVVALVGIPLILLWIGFPIIHLAQVIWAVTGLWFMVRNVVGLIFAAQGRPYPRPGAWLI